MAFGAIGGELLIRVLGRCCLVVVVEVTAGTSIWRIGIITLVAADAIICNDGMCAV